MILSRRTFLQKLRYTIVGFLIVPYVPKTFYSIPAVVSPHWVLDGDIDLEQYIIEEMSRRFAAELDKEIDLMINGDPTGVKPVGILSLPKANNA